MGSEDLEEARQLLTQEGVHLLWSPCKVKPMKSSATSECHCQPIFCLKLLLGSYVGCSGALELSVTLCLFSAHFSSPNSELTSSP